jgi:hypothetical protein
MKNILLNTVVVLAMVVAALAVYALAIRDSSGVIYKEAVVKAVFSPYCLNIYKESDSYINEVLQHYQDSIYTDSLRWVSDKPNARFGYYSFVGKWRMLMDSVQWLNVGVNFKPNYTSQCTHGYNTFCYNKYHYTGTLVDVNLQYNLTFRQRIENIFGSVENDLNRKVDSLIAAIEKVTIERYLIHREANTQSVNFNILVRE